MLRLGVSLELDAFVHAGDRPRPVARVHAGCVEQVAEPGPARQAGVAGEQPLALDEPLVHRRQDRLQLGLAQARQERLQRFVVALGAPGQRLGRVVERREVEMRRHRLARRRRRGTALIKGGRKEAVVELLVALADLVLLLLELLLQVLRVLLHNARERRELDGQQLRIGQPQHRGADGLRQGSPVDELTVGVFRVPAVIVVDGVVDAFAFVLAAKAQVERGDAQVIEEAGEVGARAQRVQPEIGPLAHRLAVVGVPGVGDVGELSPIPDRQLRLGVLDIAGHPVDELLQRVRAAHLEEAAAVAVGVEVGDRVLAQLGGVRFHPLGRAEQHRLLGVPGRVDDGAPRPPALLEQLAQRAGLLEQGDLAGDRVLGAVHPGVVVVAADDPLLLRRGARDARDDVVDGGLAPVERHR